MSRWFVLLLTLAATGSNLGCVRFREISACRTLVREVNPALGRIEALSKTAGAEQALRIAREYSELAKRLKPHASGNSALAAAVRDYVSVLESTANALGSQAEMTRGTASVRVTEPRRELERLVKRERAAVARLDAECHS